MRISDWSSDVCSSDLGFIDGRVGSGSYIAEQLPQTPRSPAPPQASVAPQSAFARRMRECHQPGSIPGGVAEGVVHAFQCGEPMTNPMLSTIWARELSRAAQYPAPGSPPIRRLDRKSVV